jgi:hypothetical protein
MGGCSKSDPEPGRTRSPLPSSRTNDSIAEISPPGSGDRPSDTSTSASNSRSLRAKSDIGIVFEPAPAASGRTIDTTSKSNDGSCRIAPVRNFSSQPGARSTMRIFSPDFSASITISRRLFPGSASKPLTPTSSSKRLLPVSRKSTGISVTISFDEAVKSVSFSNTVRSFSVSRTRTRFAPSRESGRPEYPIVASIALREGTRTTLP